MSRELGVILKSASLLTSKKRGEGGKKKVKGKGARKPELHVLVVSRWKHF